LSDAMRADQSNRRTKKAQSAQGIHRATAAPAVNRAKRD